MSLREIWVTRWLMGLLVLAMVFGPTLGQMHRMVHASSHGQALVQAAAHQQADSSGALDSQLLAGASAAEDPANCPPASWVHALFAGHGPAECQLLDQANHGFAGPPAAVAFTAVVPTAALPLPFLAAPRSVLLAAPFDARAPPLSFHIGA